MAGSSLVKKLGIKPRQRMIVLHAPKGYLEQLGPLPEEVERADTLEGTFDFVHLFVANVAELDDYAPMAIYAAKPGGLLWISYPKRSSKVITDITRDIGWDVVLNAGLESVAQISIDDIWTALRFKPRELIRSSSRQRRNTRR